MNRRLVLALIGGVLAAGDQGSAVDPYREPASRLIGAAVMDDEGLRRLSYLTDRIGNRLSGSAALDRAIEWAAAEMKRAGLENVQVLPVKVPHWVRGRESAVMLAPVERPIVMLGLGGSVATPPEGIAADVVVVSDFAQLERLGRDMSRARSCSTMRHSPTTAQRSCTAGRDLPGRRNWERLRCWCAR